MNLMTRYRDAYWTARAINGTGQTIKVLGIALAVALALAGLAIASKLGPAFGFAGLILGAVMGMPIYVLGVIVAAQGQILKATLDTAVNSSPLLSKDEIREIMSLDAGNAAGADLNSDFVACSQCGGLVLAQSAVIHSNRWYCVEHAPPSGT
jgi:hypothetical protein